MGLQTPNEWETAPVLRHLTCADADLLRRTGQGQSVARRAILACAGESWPYLMHVGSGEVQAVKFSLDGRTLIPMTLRAGDFFWGRPLVGDETIPVTLRASLPSEVTLWHYRYVIPALQRSNQAMWDLLGIMSNQMFRAADYLEELAFQPLASRLARLVLKEFAPLEGTSQTRTLTLDQMAGQVGTNREVVCRLLHHFETSGLLELTRTELMIADLKGLQQAAGLEEALAERS